jgi:hypothetical protein
MFQNQGLPVYYGYKNLRVLKEFYLRALIFKNPTTWRGVDAGD